MHRNKSGSNWIVHKLIERDNMNHHYRRLNEVQSQLHVNTRNVTSSNRANALTKKRLSKSNNDVRFEDQLRGIENQMKNQFCLDVTSQPSDKKKGISDETLDVMTRHSKYFTQPKKQFTPRVIRKVVRPNSSPAPNRLFSATLPMSSESLPIKLTNMARKPKVFLPADPQRNISDDSAFGDEHSIESSSSSSDNSPGRAAFNIKKWLEEQEEENCYVQLMCDVTADLLQRNLCTNRNMKEIIAVYIRKSRRKFTVGTNVLMKRLCDDLMIPTDNSCDDQYYGSRYSSSSSNSYQDRLEYKEDYRSFYKELKPLDNFYLPTLGVEDNADPSQKSLHFETAKSSSLSQVNDFKVVTKELDWYDEDCRDSPKWDDALKQQMNTGCAVATEDKFFKAAQVKIADAEGYFSDFTNDTENDIEEEFDFD